MVCSAALLRSFVCATCTTAILVISSRTLVTFLCCFFAHVPYYITCARGGIASVKYHLLRRCVCHFLREGTSIIYLAGVVSVLFEKESEGSVLHIHSESMRQPSRQAFVRMLGSRGGVGISPLHPRVLGLHGAQLWSFPMSTLVLVIAAHSIRQVLPNQRFGSSPWRSARAPGPRLSAAAIVAHCLVR